MGKRHNKDPLMEGWARQRLVAQEGSLSGFARNPSHKCPRWLVMARWWTELEPAARGLIEAQVAWGEVYVGVREGEEELRHRVPGCTLQPEYTIAGL